MFTIRTAVTRAFSISAGQQNTPIRVPKLRTRVRFSSPAPSDQAAFVLVSPGVISSVVRWAGRLDRTSIAHDVRRRCAVGADRQDHIRSVLSVRIANALFRGLPEAGPPPVDRRWPVPAVPSASKLSTDRGHRTVASRCHGSLLAPVPSRTAAGDFTLNWGNTCPPVTAMPPLVRPLTDRLGTRRMGELVEDLLLLASLDQGR
jgi:hypothetical protein